MGIGIGLIQKIP